MPGVQPKAPPSETAGCWVGLGLCQNPKKKASFQVSKLGDRSNLVILPDSHRGNNREISVIVILSSFSVSMIRPAVGPRFELNRILLYVFMICIWLFAVGVLPSMSQILHDALALPSTFFRKSHKCVILNGLKFRMTYQVAAPKARYGQGNVRE